MWARLAANFAPGNAVLELNSGTGEDARWLAQRGVTVHATDQSHAMLEVARRKTTGLPVTFSALDLAAPTDEFIRDTFDGAFSNFGGFNCVADLTPIAARLADWLRPGARLVLVVMGPVCLWEIGRNLLRLRPRAAFRRWARGGARARIGGVGVRVYYPAPRRVIRTFAPAFRAVRLAGLGVALPPTLRAPRLDTQPLALESLGRWEDRLAHRWPFRHLGDHYILEMERRA